jgi:hypothetical protein
MYIAYKHFYSISLYFKVLKYVDINALSSFYKIW